MPVFKGNHGFTYESKLPESQMSDVLPFCVFIIRDNLKIIGSGSQADHPAACLQGALRLPGIINLIIPVYCREGDAGIAKSQLHEILG
jgi:hypothetical protein